MNLRKLRVVKDHQARLAHIRERAKQEGWNAFKLSRREQTEWELFIRQLREYKEALKAAEDAILLRKQEEIRNSCRTDKGFIRVLHHFVGNSLEAWQAAAQNDLRVARLPVEYGVWFKFRNEVIWPIKLELGIGGPL